MFASQENLEKIIEIVKDLDGHLLDADQENRRRLQRVAMRIQIHVTLLTGNAPTTMEVMTRNISPSGLGFVSRRMFRSEERIALLLKIPKLPPKLLLARVTFGRYISGGWYEMGAEFMECVSDERVASAGLARLPGHWLAGSAGNVKSHAAATPVAATAPAAS